MHRLKLHKALSLTYFKPRSFATTFKVTNPYTQEVLFLSIKNFLTIQGTL